MATYQYANLESGQIRLLELLPGVDNDPLQGNLRVVQLSHQQFGPDTEKETISFEALSYVWGSDSKPFTLQTPTGSIPLTESLYGFLARLRREIDSNKTRLLWADGVCIDQDSTLEKEVQVRLMPSIYSTASHVLADLGEWDPDAETAIGMIDLYWRHSIWAGGDAEAYGRTMTPEEMAILLCIPLDELKRPGDDETLPDQSDERWETARQFFSRGWFSRLWVVQEFVLAREITFYCGQHHIAWRHLFAGCQEYGRDSKVSLLGSGSPNLGEFSSSGAVLFSAMAWFRSFRLLRRSPPGAQLLDDICSRSKAWTQFTKSNLVDLLQLFRHSRCKLPQDRYHALTQLSSDFCEGGVPGPAPDYSPEITEIVLRWGRFLIQQPGGENMLQRAGLWAAQDSAIPTWMQDFANSKATILELSLQESTFKAAGDTEFEVSLCSESPNFITLKGWRLDEVVDITRGLDTTFDGTRERFIIDYVKAGCEVWARAKDRYPKAYPDNLVASMAPVEAMCANTNRGPPLWKLLVGYWYVAIYSCMPEETRTWEQAATKLGQLEWFRGLDCTHEELMEGLQGFISGMCIPMMQGLRPATTQGGYFANAPSITVLGDEIWIIKGCRLPMVFRKSREHPGMYQLVGSCYCYGVMAGQMLEKEGFKFEDIIVH
ncbi:heterokaryon incompatibility protein-domain-containing protein [Echria macrotheca]|uniref:Heterokaryon incompatibility protein-domain-containing protein n=1 Tax=Echria macrotheca TaxID=438768 RepID=A0AAJ0B8R9_9PEZI|nr:heterokaryon incompatibility protein-domain-containing protein [Echria macrotheca]